MAAPSPSKCSPSSPSSRQVCTPTPSELGRVATRPLQRAWDLAAVQQRTTAFNERQRPWVNLLTRTDVLASFSSFNGGHWMQETPGERRSELLVGSSPSDGTPIQLLPRLVALLLACLISSCTPKEERADAASAAIPATGGPSSTGAVPLGTARAALVSSVPISAAGDTYLRSGSPNQNAGGDTILSLQSSGNRTWRRSPRSAPNKRRSQPQRFSVCPSEWP